MCICCHCESVSMTEFFHWKSDWKDEHEPFCDVDPDAIFCNVVRWAHQLFSALSYLHQQGISHKRLYGELTYVWLHDTRFVVNKAVLLNQAGSKQTRGGVVEHFSLREAL